MIFVMKRRQGDFGTGRNAGILKDTDRPPATLPRFPTPGVEPVSR